jgi:hypothetical protein
MKNIKKRFLKNVNRKEHLYIEKKKLLYIQWYNEIKKIIDEK